MNEMPSSFQEMLWNAGVFCAMLCVALTGLYIFLKWRSRRKTEAPVAPDDEIIPGIMMFSHPSVAITPRFSSDPEPVEPKKAAPPPEPHVPASVPAPMVSAPVAQEPPDVFVAVPGKPVDASQTLFPLASRYPSPTRLISASSITGASFWTPAAPGTVGALMDEELVDPEEQDAVISRAGIFRGPGAIEHLSRNGWTEDRIARELGWGRGEVQLALHLARIKPTWVTR